MAIEEIKVNNALIIRDDRGTNRWLDGIGPDVIKYLGELNHGMDDATGNPNAYTTTATSDGAGTSTLAKSVTAGRLFLITTAAFEYDGINATLKGESFLFTPNKPMYFGVKFQVSDADASDVMFGLIETDATLFNVDTSHAIAVAGDGAFFTSLDAVTTVTFKTYVGGAETNSADAGTALVDATEMILEFFYDGTELHGYQNGVLVGTFTADLPAANQTITPSFAYLAGAAAAKTATISWIRAIQAR